MQSSLVWIYFFSTLLLVMFIIVPKEKVLDLLGFGLVGGAVVAAVVQWLAVDIFKFWKFNVALVSIFNIPLGVLLAWIPPVIVFAYLWPRLETGFAQTLYILFFAFGTTIVEYSFVLTGARDYINWNVYLTFFLALFIHIALAYYLTRRERLI